MRRPLRASPTLALLATGLAVAAWAEDAPFDLNPNPPPRSPTLGGGPSPLTPGRASLFSPGSGRQVFVQGLLDVDYLTRDNYLDGDDNRSDSESFARIRGELGARVELDESIEVKFTVAYYDRAGQGQAAFVDDAYAVLKELFNLPNLSLKVGRQPVSWNLRTDYGALIYDSRANDPDITSWDGGRFQWGTETLVFTGYGYALPDASELFGLTMDWQPEQGRDNGLFLTLSANWQRDAIDPAINIPTQEIGKSLFTYYGGIEAKTTGGLDSWFEGAIQTGDAANDREYNGYSASGGLDFHLRTAVPLVLGVQGDWLSGDSSPGDQKISAFQNPWEGQQDTLIVEHERYGELSRDLQEAGTGLRAGKLKAEVGFDSAGRYKLKGIYGYYLLDEARNGNDAFGQEFDLVFNWQYNAAGNAMISLMGAIFLPDDGYKAVAPVQPAGDDVIFLGAANLQVSF